MASETITASEIGTITLVNKTEIWLSYRYFATYFFQKFGAGKFEGVMKPGERVVTQFTGAGLVNRYLIIDPDQEVIPTPNSSYGHQVVDGMGAMDELTAGGLLEKGASHLYPKNDLDREKEYVLNEAHSDITSPTPIQARLRIHTIEPTPRTGYCLVKDERIFEKLTGSPSTELFQLLPRSVESPTARTI
ncbi:hypothetical protein P7C70_g8120, partial [Phenoliferia sp. Uapishka_3]